MVDRFSVLLVSSFLAQALVYSCMPASEELDYDQQNAIIEIEAQVHGPTSSDEWRVASVSVPRPDNPWDVFITLQRTDCMHSGAEPYYVLLHLQGLIEDGRTRMDRVSYYPQDQCIEPCTGCWFTSEVNSISGQLELDINSSRILLTLSGVQIDLLQEPEADDSMKIDTIWLDGASTAFAR